MAMKDSLNMDALAKQVESVIVEEVTKGFSQARKEIETRVAKETINIDGINVKADGIYKETVDALEKQKTNIEKAIKKVNKELSSIQPVTPQASKLQQRYKSVDVSLSKEETQAIQDSVNALKRKTDEEYKSYKSRQQQLEKQLTQIIKLQKFESALAPQVKSFAITDETSVEQLREYVKMANDLVSIRKKLGDSKAQLDFDPGKRLSQLNQNMTSWGSRVAGENDLKRIAKEEENAIIELKSRISNSGVFSTENAHNVEKTTKEAEELNAAIDKIGKLTINVPDSSLDGIKDDFKEVIEYAVSMEEAISKVQKLNKVLDSRTLNKKEEKDLIGYSQRVLSLGGELTEDQEDMFYGYADDYKKMVTSINQMTEKQIEIQNSLQSEIKETQELQSSSVKQSHKTTISKPEIKAETQAIEEQTNALNANAVAQERVNDAEKANPNTSASTSTSRAYEAESQKVDEVVLSEQEALGRLQGTLLETAKSVDKKTDAFRQEEQVVEGAVQHEIVKLQELSGWIISIIGDLEKLQSTPINTKIEGITLSEEDITKLKTSLETVEQSINGIFDSKNITEWSNKFSTELTALSGQLNEFKDGIRIDFDKDNADNFATKSGEILNNISSIVAELGKIANVINSIDASVLVKAYDQAKSTDTANETDAKKKRKYKKKSVSDDDISKDAELAAKRAEAIERVGKDTREAIESANEGVIKSTTNFYDSQDRLVKMQIKSIQETAEGVKTVTSTINFDKKDKQAYASDVVSWNYDISEIKPVEDAYDSLIATEEKYKTLVAKRDMGIATPTDIKNLERLTIRREEANKVIQENSIVTDLQIAKQEEYNKEQEKTIRTVSAYIDAIKAKENTTTDRSVIEEKSNEPSIDIEYLKKCNIEIEKTNDLLNIIGKDNKDILGDNFDEAIKKAEKLGADLKDGKITFEQYQDSVKNIGSTLSTNITDALTDDVKKTLSKISSSLNSALKQKDFDLGDLDNQIESINNNIKGIDTSKLDLSSIKKTFTEFGGSVDLKKYTKDFNDRFTSARNKLQECASIFDKIKKGELITETDVINIKKAVAEMQSVYQDKDKSTSKLPNENTFAKILAKAEAYKSEISGASKATREELDEFIDRLRAVGMAGSQANLTELGTELELFKAKVRKAKEETKSLFDMFKDDVVRKSVNTFAQFFSLYDIINYGRQAFQISKEYDTALTEMRKVSDESVESLKNYQEETFDISDNIGAVAKNLQNSTADFQRLGHNLETASKLAQHATIYSNVGDMDIDTATEHMVSSVQAWKSEFANEVEASEAIINKYNEIGNSFAISSAEIGKAMERSAAALKAGGNSLDESLGLITAGNIIQQDAETTAAAIKILSMRVRGSKIELQEMGEEIDGVAETSSKMREQIKAISGVDIMLNEDTYKSTTQQIRELGSAYKEMTNVEQAALLELIAGELFCLKFVETQIYRTYLIALITSMGQSHHYCRHF